MKRGNGELLKVESNSADETSSSEDDEDAELLTDDLETGFFNVLSRLKKKDPKLYDENTRFFSLKTSEPAAQNTIHQEKKGKQSENHYKEWLKGQINKVEDDDVKRDLEALRDFWANPALNKDDQFLRDYILNKKFLDQDKDFNIKEEIAKLEEEEKEIEEALNFEHKYNYRFENSDQDFVENQQQIMQKPSGKKRKNDTLSESKPKWRKEDSETLKEKVQSKGDSMKHEVKSEKRYFGFERIKHQTWEKFKKAEENLKRAVAIKKELKNRNNQKKKQQGPSQELLEKKVKHEGAYEVIGNTIKIKEPEINKHVQMKVGVQKQKIKSENKVGSFAERKHLSEKETLKKALGIKREHKKKFNKKHKLQHSIMEKSEKKRSTPRKKRHRALFKNK